MNSFYYRRAYYVIIMLFFLTIHEDGLAQSADAIRFSAWSRLLSPEKTYLHIDREVYNIGDTIWLRGYLDNCSEISEFSPCNYLYIELSSARWERNYYKGISENKYQLRKRIKVKRDTDGHFTGYLALTEDLNTGLATLRAYSYWMLNGDPAYMFSKNIELRNPMKDDFVNDLKTANYSNQYTYDELGVENPFRHDILNKSGKKKEKRSEADLDLQFLPESGRYLAERPAVFGVKALNPDGLGVPVKGEIYADGVRLAEFMTNDLGMGRVEFTVPAGTKTLQALAETQVEQFQFKKNLPLPEEKAVILAVLPDTLGVSLRVAEQGLDLPDSTFLIVYDRTEIVLRSEYADCGAGKRVYYRELRPGINNVAVVDADGNVYAERPFFVFPHERVNCTFAFDKPSYGKREKVSATVTLFDDAGQPLNGDFSLSVTDEVFAPYSAEGHSIESWMLLGSELKGLIEKPQRYFNDSIPLAQRIEDIDALLLTQGWRYYDLERILQNRTERPRYGKEYTQSLSGYVTGVLGRKSKHATLCFVAQKIGFSQIADIDSTAYFALSNLDFPDSTQFIVGAQGKGKAFQKWHAPILNPEYFAADFTYPQYLKFRGYDAEYGQYAQQSYYAEDGSLVYTLAPARIVAQKTNLSPYPSDEFKPEQYRSEEQLKPYESYDLVTYIYTTCPGVHYRNGVLVGSSYIVSSRMQPHTMYPPINIFMNGMKVNQQDISGMMVSDIDALVYINGAGAAKYDFGFGGETFTARKSPPVVMISTRFPNRSAYNVTADRPLGWQRPAHFYVPRYESDVARKRFEPMRATLHWEPNLRFENGTAHFEFYTSDHQVPYLIITEGLTHEKRPVFVYKYF